MVRLAGRLITKDQEKTCVIESESWVWVLARAAGAGQRREYSAESGSEGAGADIRTPTGGRDIDHLGLFGISGE